MHASTLRDETMIASCTDTTSQHLPMGVPMGPFPSQLKIDDKKISDDQPTNPLIGKTNKNIFSTTKKNEVLECRFLRCAKKSFYTDSVSITKCIHPAAMKRTVSELLSSVSSQIDKKTANSERANCAVNKDDSLSEDNDRQQTKKSKPHHDIEVSHNIPTKTEITDTDITTTKDSESGHDVNIMNKKRSRFRKKRNRRPIQTTFELPNSSPISSLTEQAVPAIVSNSPSESAISSSVKKPLHQYVIHVKPLLILDLNGILCHRYRTDDVPQAIKCALDRHHEQQQVDKHPLQQNTDTTENTKSVTANESNTNSPELPKKIEVKSLYRIPIGNIASTPIIAREELDSFLTMLDQSFTLAIWTSAKPKTAKALVKALIPRDVRCRLLFVWGQDRCQSVSSTQKGFVKSRRSIIFRKHLSKVWTSYPIWNKENTLLVDDSPEKCPEMYSGNTLHPPPISGLKPSALNWIRKGNILLDTDTSTVPKAILNEEYVLSFSDEINIKRQETFFRELVIAWKCTLDGTFLASYLPEFGKGHMGWRSPVKS